MEIFRKSLKGKMIIGYSMGFCLMLVLIAVSWNDMRNIERMVTAGEVVSDLYDTSLEIRRFEKNYFLYGTEADYGELMAYISRTDDLLKNRTGELRLFASAGELNSIRESLIQYRSHLTKSRELEGSAERWQWGQGIRQHGRAVVDIAEGIAARERTSMRATLVRARHTLFLSIVLILVSSAMGGTFFYHKVIHPLKTLELHMEEVARGDFSPVEMNVRDSELASLNRAFNRMLHDLEERKSYLVSSEKLASLGTLLFGVAHELNNPISNISTSAQILMEEIGEEDLEYKRSLIHQIEEGAERAQRIVGSLLDYSRTGSRERVRLFDIVDETLRFIKGELPTKVELSVSVPQQIVLMADKQKLQQVFLNLIMNAVEATMESGRVNIAARENQRKGVVLISVEDTGTGMDKDMLSKIFNPFFTTKGAKKGYGLGLFIVHNIITEHGGTITVNSESGYGTTFLIELPMEGHGNEGTGADTDC